MQSETKYNLESFLSNIVTETQTYDALPSVLPTRLDREEMKEYNPMDDSNDNYNYQQLSRSQIVTRSQSRRKAQQTIYKHTEYDNVTKRMKTRSEVMHDRLRLLDL